MEHPMERNFPNGTNAQTVGLKDPRPLVGHQWFGNAVDQVEDGVCK